jgi:hypothetical protein
MQPHSTPQKRILCLINGYPTCFGGVETYGSDMAHSVLIARELKARPGHWFLVGKMTKVNGREVKVGSEPVDMRRRGYEAARVDGHIYARTPHESGVPLNALVTKQPTYLAMEKLPELTVSTFGWSKNELKNATATAHAWLFETEGIAAA